jgi:2-oxoglutarate dehydrogenase complex dihydrolipoamide succinyltransferase (E2) component
VSSSRTEQANLVEMTMPQMGVSVAEGTIVKWHKHPGDWVEADETVCEISTDKIDTELPSPASGRLVRILAEENATVAVGSVLAEIDPGAQPGHAHVAEANGSQSAVGSRQSAGGGRQSAESDRSHVISPVVRRVAEEHGIDLSRVKGTGVGGRIRKKDVLAFVEQGPPVDRPLHTESPYRPEPEPEPAHGELRTANRELRTPLSPMRKQIAEHMLRSRRTAAHVTTVAEVDMSRVVARREQLKEPFGARGAPLTYLAFVARATVAALQDHPALNTSIDDRDLIRHEGVNLGIAVALEDGLMVPVIHAAHRLNLEGLAGAIADVAGRAREKRLTAEDVQGGTFTITNPGQFGTVLATPIVNQPQVAILDLEAIVKRAVVVESGGGDSIAIRPMANLCLSFDHRALDGADAARFLGAVKARLEQWSDDA